MNMTSATAPGAPGAKGDACECHLQEFLYKFLKNRLNLYTRGFWRSRNTNITSATVPGAPGAQGTTVKCHLQEFL